MLSIIPFIHQLFTDTIHEGDIVVDATLGNGHDSLVLSKLVGDNGKVSGFSIFNKKRLTKQNNDSQKTTVITFIPS